MALPKENVQIAIKLFEKIAGEKLCKRSIPYHKLDDCKNIVGEVILFGSCSDGGYENVVMQIKDMTDKQRDIWEENKKSVRGNTNFIDTKPDGITMFGYI